MASCRKRMFRIRSLPDQAGLQAVSDEGSEGDVTKLKVNTLSALRLLLRRVGCNENMK